MSYPPQPPPPPYGQVGNSMGPPPPTHGSATTSLILGIVSLVACGLLTGIPAMIIGRRAKREIAASNGQLGGEGLANAGFITGLIGTILSALGTMALIALLVVGAVVSESFEEGCQTYERGGEFTVDC